MMRIIRARRGAARHLAKAKTARTGRPPRADGHGRGRIRRPRPHSLPIPRTLPSTEARPAGSSPPHPSAPCPQRAPPQHHHAPPPPPPPQLNPAPSTRARSRRHAPSQSREARASAPRRAARSTPVRSTSTPRSATTNARTRTSSSAGAAGGRCPRSPHGVRARPRAPKPRRRRRRRRRPSRPAGAEPKVWVGRLALCLGIRWGCLSLRMCRTWSIPVRWTPAHRYCIARRCRPCRPGLCFVLHLSLALG